MTASKNVNGKDEAAGRGVAVFVPRFPDPDVQTQAASVDWLTVTAKEATYQGLLFDEANRVMDVLKRQGNVQKPWGFKGYTGYSCGGFRWGSRHDSSICMLSGDVAQMNWPVMLAWAGKVTRLDLAVTVTLLEPLANVASDAYDFLTLRGTVSGGRTRKYTLMQNNSGGQTMYVGSRASDQYGRLYDKGREQDKDDTIPIGKIWRFEVEFKAYRADRIAAQLLEVARFEQTHARDQIAATVYKWYLSRGIKPIWDADDNAAFSMETSAKLSDEEVTLEWLSRQVSPSVTRLIERGRGTEVLEALGIADG